MEEHKYTRTHSIVHVRSDSSSRVVVLSVQKCGDNVRKTKGKTIEAEGNVTFHWSRRRKVKQGDNSTEAVEKGVQL